MFNENELEIELLSGVGVRDIPNGVKVVLMGTNDNIVDTFEVECGSIEDYNDMKLYSTCLTISKRVNDLYYEYEGELTQEIVENVVKEEI